MEAGEVRVGSNAEALESPCRVSAAKEEVIVAEEGSCGMKCMAAVLVSDKMCFLSKEDMGGYVVNYFREVMEAVGAQAVHIERGECA